MMSTDSLKPGPPWGTKPAWREANRCIAAHNQRYSVKLSSAVALAASLRRRLESIFGLPGIGQYFINAALNRDYGMVLGTVIFYMVLIILLNLVVDLVYALLDPKVRAH